MQAEPFGVLPLIQMTLKKLEEAFEKASFLLKPKHTPTLNMNTINEIKFEGGKNIAIKILQHQYEETLGFYRDILLLDVEEQILNHPTVSKTAKVKFGENILWLDCVNSLEQSNIWLEINTSDIEKATAYLQVNNIATHDHLEQIPKGMHWIKDPAGNIFIVKEKNN